MTCTEEKPDLTNKPLMVITHTTNMVKKQALTEKLLLDTILMINMDVKQAHSEKLLVVITHMTNTVEKLEVIKLVQTELPQNTTNMEEKLALSKKILLAASSKNVNYEGLSENQKSQMMLSLNDFIGFGVRDENTFDLVASFIPKEKLELIPDPTFSLEIDDRITDEYLKKKQILIPQKSLLFHTTKSDNKWAATAAKEYRGQGYKIYSLRPAPWADEVLNDMSPLEQLGIYRYFECVITHRFHDAVFCLKNMTPMLLYTPHGFSSTNGVKSKFTHLLDMFGLLQSNYMETPQDEIFLKMGKSISSFNVRRDKIATQLNDCSKLFYNYINQFK